MDNELQSLRSQVQSLQVDLDNSEAVQRDFVKLSQSLQVSLWRLVDTTFCRCLSVEIFLVTKTEKNGRTDQITDIV